jgi:hypothetical protein
MRRTIRPSLEVLEGKALLSGVSATASGLAYSLTAVASRTVSGAQVVATFTETNVTNQVITVDHGPSDDGFDVAQGGKTIWSSETGAIPAILEVDQLEPHQSLTFTATWDGRANEVNPNESWVEGPPLSGTFTVSNWMDQGKTATVTIPKSWTEPVKQSRITPPRPPAMVHEMATVAPLPQQGHDGPRLNPSSS